MTGLTTVEIEIELARQSWVPVLITAPPDHALAIALAIAAGGQKGTSRMVLCDGAAIVSAARGDRRENGTTDHGVTLVVQEVHALSETEQAALMQLFKAGEEARHRRIIATSSACLLDRVQQGTFNKTLFYQLNIIHIVSHSCGDRDEAMGPCRLEGAGGCLWGPGGSNLSAPSC